MFVKYRIQIQIFLEVFGDGAWVSDVTVRVRAGERGRPVSGVGTFPWTFRSVVGWGVARDRCVCRTVRRVLGPSF